MTTIPPDPDDLRAQTDHERKADKEQPTPHIAKIDTRYNPSRADGVHEWQWVCTTCGQHGDWVLNQKVATRGAEKHIHHEER